MRAGIVVLGVMVLAGPAWAQTPPPSTPNNAVSADVVARHQQLRVMERALEEAVTQGVRSVERRLPVVPGLVFFAGQVRVRGFDLEDYGVFFDVEYPVVRRSILWSMNTLQLTGGMSRVLEDLRRRVQAMPEGPGQLAFGQAIAEMQAELQRTSPTSPSATRVNGATDDGGPRPDEVGPETTTIDPTEAYVAALTAELARAMVSYGGQLAVDDDQWLSVAARDGRGRMDPRVPGASRTLKLRVRGQDLAALGEGRLSVDEVIARIERDVP